MRHMLKNHSAVKALALTTVSFFIPLNSSTTCYASEASTVVRPPHIVFINPSTPSGAPFWSAYTGFMKAAADDLGIELEVLYAGNDRGRNYSLAREALKREHKPDYLIHTYAAGQGLRTLAAANSANVPSVVVNTDISADELKRSGLPGEKYPLWLYHLSVDDQDAGYQLADYLIRKRGALHDTELNTAQVLAINGKADSSASIFRLFGLQQAIAEHDVQLMQQVHSTWTAADASSKLPLLLARHPQSSIVWCASDSLALGATESLKSLGKVPGVDVLVGGIDGLHGIESKIRSGAISASISGHFMGGAWALILVHDYHNGLQKSSFERQHRVKMQLISPENLSIYEPVLLPQNWSLIDFRKFSKLYHNESEQYEFSMDAALKYLDK
ncbi:MAG: ABC-type sugar transport system substrate-binding protein [Flavobacteriales bacterium]|jgi:ABC-type sugar transport system substrate-binding protein